MKSARIKIFTIQSHCSSSAETSPWVHKVQGEIFPSLTKCEFFSLTNPLSKTIRTASCYPTFSCTRRPQTSDRFSHLVWSRGQHSLPAQARTHALQLPASHFCLDFRWTCSPPALSMYSKLHALNISQKFKVTEPEVLQSGTLKFRKLVRILECACSLFNCSTSFSYMLLGTAVQDTY